MKFLPLLSLLGMLVSTNSCSADVITTINFNDAIWDIQITETASGITGANVGSQFGGDSLSAQRMGTAGGAVIVTATLNGTISTAGFENVELEFTNQSSNNLEHNASNFADGSGDAFTLTSAQGIDFSTLNATSTFRDALNAGGIIWSQTNASTHGQTLTFDSSADNGSISNLVIQLKVDGSNELVRLGGLTLSGTVATPEPGSFILMLISAVAVVIYRRARGAEKATSTSAG